MDLLKEPGIAIERILLLKSHVEMVKPDGQRKYNLRLTALARLEPPDGKTLELHAAFDLMNGIESPLFRFTCEFLVSYTRQDDANMAWQEFTSAMALAHIVPYLREYVNNITNRLPAPVLILPPINTHAMIADYEKRKLIAEQSRAVGQTPQKPA